MIVDSPISLHTNETMFIFQEFSEEIKKKIKELRRRFLLRITEAELRGEIMKRIYRRIAINSSLENFSHTYVANENFDYQNRNCDEPDTQYKME
jgi:hypothetical protein